MKYLITRADDFGSAKAANQAILQAVEKGSFLKNVSCMAAAPHIEEDAEALERLHREKHFCIGLHAVLNSEWEKIHFCCVQPPEKIPSLVCKEGVFAAHPMMFKENMPEAEECILEIWAQLDKLTRLGLTAEYLDTHMLPEAAVPGLMEELTAFAAKHGLVDHRGFYSFPPEHQPVLDGLHTLTEDAQAYGRWFECMAEERQYINILHPAYYSEETKMFYNQFLKGEKVAYSREAEQRLLNSGMLEGMCKEKDIICLRYTDAAPQGDTTMDAAQNF